MQTTYINIETNDDASYDKAYNEYNTKNNFIDRMVIDLRRQHITARQSAMLFGRLLIDDWFDELRFINMLPEDVETVCEGVCDRFREKFPDGIETGDGVLMKPYVQVELKPGKINRGTMSLDIESMTAVMIWGAKESVK